MNTKTNPPPAPSPTSRRLPSVAIVGRPNVGKSALFNRLARRRISIVHDEPGITRDRIATTIDGPGRAYELVDTGGIGAPINDSFDEQVRAEADIAIASADLILLVIDARQGLTPVDRDLSRQLRRAKGPVLVVANKIDTPAHEQLADELTATGHKHILPVSAAHGRGIDDLEQAIAAGLGPDDTTSDTHTVTPETDTPNPKIAIIGRPNVGKSSLVNALLHSRRTIVSEVSGTTRDAVDIPFSVQGSDYLLIDTAGIRPKSRRQTSAEVFSVIRSEKSIRRADLCVLVVDGAHGVTAQDKKIAGLIQKAGKPCVIAVNKWDLIADSATDKQALRALIDQVRRDLFFLDYAPVLFLSARSGEHVARLFRAIGKVRSSANTQIPTGQLNRFIHDLLEHSPPPLVKGKRFKILYLTQTSSDSPVPVPRFLLFTNSPETAPPNYLRFLERAIRQLHPYDGLPILLDMRGREKRHRK